MKMLPVMQKWLQFSKLQTGSTLSRVNSLFVKLAQLLNSSKTSVEGIVVNQAGCWGGVVSTWTFFRLVCTLLI